MRKCTHDCQAACDFCVFFDYNGEDLIDFDGQVWSGALYVGKGYCNFHKRDTDPGWECDDFCCMNVFRDKLDAENVSTK